ncbi:single-stranded DNA-binding protein [Candidatus Cardinium hertigii]|uniref:Single-stranded DNA-binding protein n=1 Tax=Candidatus Cardinium hertigii TaxID=247481 RepID=A0A2Z3LI70_9BACT|nr:single-stranded DNA-binding protein [Candidatus Cardinium hertigii]AWN82154.1 Single-stranded DNA-binding protein [Candidatus Cardinium hertigii]
MASVNKVILLGNLGRDPEVRHLENGRLRVQLILATHANYKTKEGERVSHTDWHEIVLWTPHAEIAAQYLSKGKQVYIEGKLSRRAYVDKEGQHKYTTQIVCQQLVLLGNKANHAGEVEVVHPRHKPYEDDMGELPL